MVAVAMLVLGIVSVSLLTLLRGVGSDVAVPTLVLSPAVLIGIALGTYVVFVLSVVR